MTRAIAYFKGIDWPHVGDMLFMLIVISLFLSAISLVGLACGIALSYLALILLSLIVWQAGNYLGDQFKAFSIIFLATAWVSYTMMTLNFHPFKSWIYIFLR